MQLDEITNALVPQTEVDSCDRQMTALISPLLSTQLAKRGLPFVQSTNKFGLPSPLLYPLLEVEISAGTHRLGATFQR